MHLKLTVNITGQIECATIYNSDGSELRKADLNKELIELINSVEIDMDEYLKLKQLVSKNGAISKLIKSIDLKLITK
jgi:hypothetical protein